MYDLIVIGGGAAGIFAAIAAKRANSGAKVAVLEKSAHLLSKVRISGGGRCNVTHSCFDPALLVRNYPRGSQELRGPFNRFQPKDTIEWFALRGVDLKTEADGRMFPTTDSSQTIIDCLLGEAKKLGVEILLKQKIESVQKTKNGFEVGAYFTQTLLLATGSAAEGLAVAEKLGHTIQKPVPSLFTFNVPTSPLKDLSGISVESAELKIVGLKQKGPLLITHFGFSGPAVLKLSAWGARALFEKHYRAELIINWLPDVDVLEKLMELKKAVPQRTLIAENPFRLPKKLWKGLVGTEKRFNDYSNKDLQTLFQKITNDSYLVDGKTTHKEEFVTCGGVTLKEICCKTMESKVCSGLCFAGEVLDIDGVTGGFNFQNAWTTGFIAGVSAAI